MAVWVLDYIFVNVVFFIYDGEVLLFSTESSSLF